jgi:amino acid transporter
VSGARSSPLRRTLGFWVLLFYGLGVIVGAGIYVLVGAVAAKAGMSAPLAFLLAGALAALTGLSYAELVVRVPEASGAAGYIHTASRSALAGQIAGFTVIITTMISASTIASGSAGYIGAFVSLPAWLPAAAFVAIYTGIACMKVEIGATFAALLSVVEIGGLLFATALGLDALGQVDERWRELLPRDQAGWHALAQGAFLAFFAYTGFETLANMAEETRDVGRTLPRAIIGSIVLSATLYVLVMLTAVMALPLVELSSSAAPLCLLVERAGIACGSGFAVLALVALGNGVIVQLILAARQMYGMAERGLLPAWFGAVHPRSRVPVRATLIGGTITLVLVVSFHFESLANFTSALTLTVFAAVNASLFAIKARERVPAVQLRLPAWVPLVGCIASLALLGVAFWP